MRLKKFLQEFANQDPGVNPDMVQYFGTEITPIETPRGQPKTYMRIAEDGGKWAWSREWIAREEDSEWGFGV